MWGMIDPKGKHYSSICRIAAKAHEEIAYFHKPEYDPENAHQWMTVGEFVTHLLHHCNKPISENLIIKRIRENNVPMPFKNVHELLVNMYALGMVVSVQGEGHILTGEMKKLIESSKPK